MRKVLLACALLLPGLLPPGVAQDAPPAPEARIAELRAARALEHADLGIWAAGRKLALEARAHLAAAIRLDPDCGKARVKLGHRRKDDGAWDESKEREIRDEPEAREKNAAEFATRERKVLAEEAAAFEALGLAFRDENRADLARDLLLHAAFLAPEREGAARGLGLVPAERGFALPETAEALVRVPDADSPVGGGFLGDLVGVATAVRHCGSVFAEVPGDGPAAARIAVLGEKAVALGRSWFGADPLPPRWAWLAVARSYEQFCAFVDALGLGEQSTAVCKQLGTVRVFQPRHLLASWSAQGAGAEDCLPIFLHSIPEDLLYSLLQDVPPIWLMEAAGVEAVAVLLGQPGPLCTTWESSQGLVTRDTLKDLGVWPALLYRRTALSDQARLELLRTAQLQAMSGEDVVAAHAYFRLLRLTRPGGLAAYVDALGGGAEEIDAFRSAFGATHEEVTAELARIVRGR